MRRSSLRAPEKPIELAHSDAGGDGRPVLFVHGFSHTRCVWEPLARGLAPQYRPIAVDLRGHGESGWSPEGHYDIHDYASDLPATLDALGVERAIVVAHSLGGNAATLFAASVPERVEALVLVDTGPALSLSGVLHIAGDAEALLRSCTSIDAFRDRLALIHPNADPALLTRMAETGLVRRRDGRFEPALDPGVLSGTCAPEELAEFEQQLWDELAKIRCATLVVRGGRSALLGVEAAGKMVDDVLPHGRLETLATAGHSVMLDDAAGLARCLDRFLSTLAS